jgi:hypothetical protein
VAVITLSEKSIFNLRVDTVQPLLSPLGSFLIGGDFGFQLRDPIFGSTQLMREPLRCLQGVSAVFFCSASRSVEQLQDRLACFVELIGTVRCRSFGPCKRDHIRLVTTDLTVHHLPPSLDLSNHIAGRPFHCGIKRSSQDSIAFCLGVWRISNSE